MDQFEEKLHQDLHQFIGAWLGMKGWHHKTQHKKFKKCCKDCGRRDYCSDPIK